MITELLLCNRLQIIFYFINTNEISGELSRENMLTSHVKINRLSSLVKRSPLLRLYNKLHLSQGKLKALFHWCLCNNQNMTGPLGETKFLFFFFFFLTREEKFRISARPSNILVNSKVVHPPKLGSYRSQFLVQTYLPFSLLRPGLLYSQPFCVIFREMLLG